MRGADVTQESMFSYMTLSKFVPAEHPLRAIREILNEALREMDEIFAGMYADTGRDSIPPGQPMGRKSPVKTHAMDEIDLDYGLSRVVALATAYSQPLCADLPEQRL